MLPDDETARRSGNMVEWSRTGVERQRGEYRFTVKDKEGEKVWLVGESAGRQGI